MSRSSSLILLGILIIIVPLSGLPESWIAFILAVLGIIVVILGIALRTEQVRHARDAAYVPPTLPTAPESAAEPVGPSSIA